MNLTKCWHMNLTKNFFLTVDIPMKLSYTVSVIQDPSNTVDIIVDPSYNVGILIDPYTVIILMDFRYNENTMSTKFIKRNCWKWAFRIFIFWMHCRSGLEYTDCDPCWWVPSLQKVVSWGVTLNYIWKWGLCSRDLGRSAEYPFITITARVYSDPEW